MRKYLLAGAAIGSLLSVHPASANLLSNIRQPLTSTVGSTVSTILPVTNGLVLDAPANANDPKVHPFYGNINPFYGNINPFYGNINPFYGNINPFWGTINPFDSSIGPFWQNAGPQWGALNTLWNNLQASNATDY